MATGKNLCPYSDGLDNLGKSDKAWGNTHTKNLYVTGNAEIQTLKVGGETDIQGYVKKTGGTMTGNLTVPTVIGNLNGTADIAKKDTDSHDIVSSYLSRNNDANYPVSMVSSLDDAIREGLYNVSLSTSLTADKSYKRGRLLTLNNQLDKNNAQNQIFQTFFSIDGDILTRHKIDSNSWTDWIKLMTANDMPKTGIIDGNVSNPDAWWFKVSGTIPIIIQGGYNQVQKTVTFPIPFPSTTLSVMATLSRGDQEAAQTWSYTTKDFYLYQRYGNRWAHWVAIGF